MATYIEARGSFGSLLHWHLVNGTRPAGDRKAGRSWENGEFARAVGDTVDERSVRYWRQGHHLPRLPDHIERALFGAEVDEQYLTWRDDLRTAYIEAQQRRSIDTRRANIGNDQRRAVEPTRCEVSAQAATSHPDVCATGADLDQANPPSNEDNEFEGRLNQFESRLDLAIGTIVAKHEERAAAKAQSDAEWASKRAAEIATKIPACLEAWKRVIRPVIGTVVKKINDRLTPVVGSILRVEEGVWWYENEQGMPRLPFIKVRPCDSTISDAELRISVDWFLCRICIRDERKWDYKDYIDVSECTPEIISSRILDFANTFLPLLTADRCL